MADSSSTPRKYSPILGLPIDDDDAVPYKNPVLLSEGRSPQSKDPEFSGHTHEADSISTTDPQLSVIIPARNEETNLPLCLASLLAQNDDLFQLGRDWELIVIDDASTDGTLALARTIATSHAGITVIEAPPLELRSRQRAFTGKTQACWLGAQQSRGQWLLFTDADTRHEPGNLLRALHEAQKNRVALLSYSPRQIVSGLTQRTLMPLIFSELATVYPPAQVNDPARRLAAANGQFLLVERAAYFAVGGHRAVGRSVLEDVDLAWNVKRSCAGKSPAKTEGGIRLRYAPEALSTRMYTGLADMLEGWSKNLALLFPHALSLAAWRLLDIALLLLPFALLLFPYLVLWQRAAIVLLWARTLLRFYRRVARSNFSVVDCALSIFALPLFIVLLLQSWLKHRIFHRVTWKGREYTT